MNTRPTEHREISRLHYITQDVSGRSHADLAELACRGGVRWVQVRLKNRDMDAWYRGALEVKRRIEPFGAHLIVNDHPAIAREIEASGVHVGPDDLPPAEVRKLLGPSYLVGGSANSYEEACALIEQGVDYIGLGPLRTTSTKSGLRPVLGFERVSGILERLSAHPRAVPVVVIGGVTVEDVPALRAAGAHGVAVASAVNMHPAPERAAAEFVGAVSPNRSE